MTRARACALVAFVAASLAACSTVLELPDTEEPPFDGGTEGGGADGESRDGDASLDGAPITEAGADADVDVDAETGASGMPFTLTIHVGTKLLGVAATATRVYFTEPGPPGKIWFINRSPPITETGLFGNEPGLGAIKVTGANEIQWSKGMNGVDGLSGVFKSSFDGTGRQAAMALDVPNCRGFAFSPQNIHHCAIAGTGEIRRVQGAGITNNWVSGGGANIFIDSYTSGGDTLVVWTESTSIRMIKADATDSSTGTLILAGIAPVGVAVKDPWIYFTQTSGSIERIKLNRADRTTLFAPALAPPDIGDITVAPDGLTVYWAEGSKIMGLAVVP